MLHVPGWCTRCYGKGPALILSNFQHLNTRLRTSLIVLHKFIKIRSYQACMCKNAKNTFTDALFENTVIHVEVRRWVRRNKRQTTVTQCKSNNNQIKIALYRLWSWRTPFLKLYTVNTVSNFKIIQQFRLSPSSGILVNKFEMKVDL